MKWGNMFEGLLKGSMAMSVGCTKSGKTKYLSDLHSRMVLKKQVCGYFQAKKGEKGFYVSEPSQIFERGKNLPILLIDNIHLMSPEVTEILTILKMSKQLYVTSEEITPYGLAYPHVGKLLCHADQVTKLSAVCTKCGADARYTYVKAKKDNEKQIKVEPRCFTHWQKRTL